ncbi:MAG: AFG1/ZapE family ATPase, partial [Rhodobiaceae bacterium]
MTEAQSSPQSANVTARFQALVDSGQLSADAAQFEAARRLDALNDALTLLHAQSGLATSVKKWLGKPVETPRGLYIFGAVGRGKSMLMDMFFEGAQVKRKRRVHFHAFM